MRILQLLCFPLYGSGSGSYVRKLSEHLAKLGHEVAIVCPDTREVPGVTIFNVDMPIKAAFTGHPEWPNCKLYSDLTGAEIDDIQMAFRSVIINAVETFKPDVIHVHHASILTWIANYIRAVYQIDYLVTSHNTDIMCAIVDKRYIPLTQDALNRADYITAVSQDTRERLLRIIGKGLSLRHKARIIPVGVDTKVYNPTLSTRDIDKEYGLKDKKVVLYVGKIMPHKGVEYLIQAAPQINAEVLIVGGGEATESLKQLATRVGAQNVRFLGYFNKDRALDLPKLYRRANVTVVPSVESEGIPMSAVESLAAGTPVVGTPKGGVTDAVRHEKTGLIVRPRSAKAIAEAVNRILDNPKLEAKLSAEGRILAENIFGWKSVCQAYVHYYEKTYENTMKRRKTKRAAFIKHEDYIIEKRKLESTHRKP